MITYSKSWGGLFLVFRVVGTSWPSGIFPGLLAAGVSALLGAVPEVDDEVRNRSTFIDHPYAFQLFAYLLGVLMVFRTNFAYSRYWEAISSVQAMASKWLDGVCMAIAFDAGGSNDAPLLYGTNEEPSNQPHETLGHKGGPNHAKFVQELVHLVSLLHALALQHLREDPDLNNLDVDMAGETLTASAVPRSWTTRSNGTFSDHTRESTRSSVSDPRASVHRGISNFSLKGLKPVYSETILKNRYSECRLPVLGGLSSSERKALEHTFMSERIPTEARVAMVQGWYMRRLIARQKFEQGESSVTSPPILSRLYQVISDGTLWFSHASKIATTPFPFPYHNLISIFLWIYTFLVPVLVNGIIMENTIRFVFSFIAVFSYHALAAVGDNLEDPYLPYDPNELPLADLQRSLNYRLLAYSIVPEREGEDRLRVDTSLRSPPESPGALQKLRAGRPGAPGSQSPPGSRSPPSPCDAIQVQATKDSVEIGQIRLTL